MKDVLRPAMSAGVGAEGSEEFVAEAQREVVKR